MGDLAHFDALMKSYYQNRYEKVSATNRELWDLAILLVRQISESQLDGSSISDLKAVGERATATLKEMLEREQAP